MAESKTCVDCGRLFTPKQQKTQRCQSCFYVSRSKADNKNQQIKKKLKKERGDSCENCGSMTKLFIHHIRPVKDGGSPEMSNLKLLCHDCHLKAHNGGWRNL